MKTLVEGQEEKGEGKGLDGWEALIAAKLMNPVTRRVTREGVLERSQEETEFWEWADGLNGLDLAAEEVLGDEVDGEVVERVRAQEGGVGVLLVNGERAGRVERVWRGAHQEYYGGGRGGA